MLFMLILYVSFPLKITGQRIWGIQQPSIQIDKDIILSVNMFLHLFLLLLIRSYPFS